MSSESAMHKRNLESSILFMQQEHAATLKALHEEIAQLQKRCTDLTFQLTMHGLTIDETGSETENKMSQVQAELESSRQQITTLEKELSDRDSRVERLEAESRSQRKRWLDESRHQAAAMNSLRAELEAKANSVAYLTTELHRLKQKSRTAAAGGDGEGLPQDTQSNVMGSTSKKHLVPQPPPQREKTMLGSSASSTRHRRHHHGSMLGGKTGSHTQGGHPASADAHLTGRHHHNVTTAASVPGSAANPLRVGSGRSSGSDTPPDISPFLSGPGPAPEDVLVLQGKKQTPVLPPISATSGGQVLVHKVVSSGSQHRQMGGKSPRAAGTTGKEASVVTLAVENAAGSSTTDATWGLAQQARGSEYN